LIALAPIAKAQASTRWQENSERQFANARLIGQPRRITGLKCVSLDRHPEQRRDCRWFI